MSETIDRYDRIRAGDAQEMSRSFDEARPRLERILHFRIDARLAGRLDTDDVLQEAFLSAQQRCGHFEGSTEQALLIWFRLITLQTLTDLHRRHVGTQKRAAGRELAIDSADHSATSAPIAAFLVGNFTSPTAAVRRTEMAERLRAALDQLDAIDREVLTLRHFEELSNLEVAEALGIQPKAASIRYVRALRRLKEILVEVGMADSTSAGATGTP